LNSFVISISCFNS